MKPYERLQVARERAGYSSATAAAEAFGWVSSTYLGHENGSRGLKPDTAQRYARAFGVSWSWLLSGDHDLEDVVNLLTPIPVTGVIDPGALRPPGFRLQDMPKEIHMEVFGYEPKDLEAFAVYGSTHEHQHFVISSKSAIAGLHTDDEIITWREEGGRIECAAWRVTRAGDDYVLSAAYAPHVSMSPFGMDMLNEPGVEIAGVVVAELRVKRRRIWPPVRDDA